MSSASFKMLISTVFPTGPECSIRSCGWCLCCRLQSCTNTQKLHPTLHSDHHPGPALLHCRHASAAAKYSNTTLMMQRRLLGELKTPSLRLSMVQLHLINWEWIHDAWRSLVRDLHSSPRPILLSNYHEWSLCNKTNVICLWGHKVERKGESKSNVALKINDRDAMWVCVCGGDGDGGVSLWEPKPDWASFPRGQIHKFTYTQPGMFHICALVANHWTKHAIHHYSHNFFC